MQNSVGFVIGNGLSRENFDLEKLNGHGVTIGCNGLYETYNPDFIVSLDGGQKHRDAFAAGPSWGFIDRYYDERVKGWVRLNGKTICGCIDINQGWNNNSGIMAAGYLAEILKLKTVYLLGIDFFLQVPGRDNDLISGNTPHASNVFYPFNKLPSNSPETKFIRVGPIAKYDREFYDKLEGFELIDYDEFPY